MKRICDDNESFQGGIFLSPFQCADIVDAETGPLSQVLLPVKISI